MAISPNRFKAKQMLIYGGRYIYKTHNNNESIEWITFYHGGIADLIKKILIVLSLNMISYSIVGMQCLIMLIVFGIRINIIGTILPFTDATTDEGYYANFALQLICFAYAMCFNYSTECSACIVNNTITTMAGFICLKVNDLNEILDSNKSMNATESRLQRIEIKSRLRDILIYVQDFDR